MTPEELAKSRKTFESLKTETSRIVQSLPPPEREKALMAKKLYLESISISDPLPALLGMILAVGDAVGTLRDMMEKDSHRSPG